MKALYKIRERLVHPKRLVRYIRTNFRSLDYNRQFDLYRDYVETIETMFENKEWFDIAIKLGMVRGDGEPVRCHHCGGVDFKKAPYYEEGTLCEMEVQCNSCKNCTGRWIHGYWEV
jgi:hypothetical protein